MLINVRFFWKPCSSASHWSFAFQWTGPVHWLVSCARPPQTQNMMSAHQKYKHTVCACTEKLCMYPWADRTFSKRERTKLDFLDLLLVQNITKKIIWIPDHQEARQTGWFFFSFFQGADNPWDSPSWPEPPDNPSHQTKSVPEWANSAGESRFRYLCQGTQRAHDGFVSGTLSKSAGDW